MQLRFALAIGLVASLANAAEPTLPQNTLDTTYRPTSCTTTVASGGNVQTAINGAALGDTICLEAGATFTGNFTLPNKGAGSSYIIVRTATEDRAFPRPGVRVGTSDASVMSKLTAGSGSILATENGAHHYRFIGLEITPSTFLTNLIDLGPPSGLLADMPSYLIFDRCYIHGHATNGSRRGIALNSSYTAVIDSHLSEFMEVGADSQAIAGWGGPGPFKIINNYLSGAGENVLFGGADPAISNMVPSDVEFRRNYVYKPLTWRVGDPSYAGTHWAVKNSFELKNAQRVLIENNYFFQNWADGQTGTAILFTPRNQSGGCNWCVVQDVTFRNNIVKSAAGGMSLMGEDTDNSSQTTYRIAIRNNLFDDINQVTWAAGGSSYIFLTTGGSAGTHEMTIEYNTAFIPTTNTAIDNLSGQPLVDLIQRYNISSHSDYGIIGDSTAVGNATLNAWAPGAIYTANVMTDQPSLSGNYSSYSGNFFPTNMAAVNFVNLGAGNYRLDPTSAYDAIAPNGRDLGAWFPAVGQTAFTATVDAKGTDAIVRFGMPGMSSSTSCSVRYGASSTTSSSGPAMRYVVISGLSAGSSYGITIDCGDAAGAVVPADVVAYTPSGGNRTVPIGVKPAAILTTAARVTIDYGTTSAVADGSVQNTDCASGCTVNLTIPAGLRYWRARWQTSGDAVIATGAVQPIAVE